MRQYAHNLIWHGTWLTPTGLRLLGFHLWDSNGVWVGVYSSATRAKREAKI